MDVYLSLSCAMIGLSVGWIAADYHRKGGLTPNNRRALIITIIATGLLAAAMLVGPVL